MKVLISADMEGTCGVVSWVQVMPPEVARHAEPTSLDEYTRTRERMTAEVNAAVEGALAGGADEVIVNDSHDGMRNLLPDELHPAVRFISGNDKPLGMMQGVDLAGVGERTGRGDEVLPLDDPVVGQRVELPELPA